MSDRLERVMSAGEADLQERNDWFTTPSHKYRILDRLKRMIVSTQVGLKAARKRRDELNSFTIRHTKGNPNEWRYCLFKGHHPLNCTPLNGIRRIELQR